MENKIKRIVKVYDDNEETNAKMELDLEANPGFVVTNIVRTGGKIIVYLKEGA